MKTSILTSGFTNGFTSEFSNELHRIITKKDNFVFIASEFEKIHKKTDWYCNYFLSMFSDCGIEFKDSYVIDSRMSPESAQRTVSIADVLWLSGGDTPTQYNYIKSYGLIPFIKEYNGITIGMSAGSINMTNTAICTVTCEHKELKIYQALGLVDISVEPHLDSQNVSDELIQLSEEYSIYGICDNGAIIVEDSKVTYLGDIFLINKGIVKQIH